MVLIIMPLVSLWFRLNYTDDGQVLDAQDVTVTTGEFGSLSSLADLSDFIADFPPSDNPSILEYFTTRGYILDQNIRAASYDWRLGAGMLVFF